MAISESTHVRVTLTTVATVAVFVVAALWRMATWAGEVETAKQVSAETAETVSDLAQVVKQQVWITGEQQKTVERLAREIEADRQRNQEAREALIRLEARLR